MEALTGPRWAETALYTALSFGQQSVLKVFTIEVTVHGPVAL